jgi:hypothetical protein
MKKEFQKLVSNIEHGIERRGFFFVLYKQVRVISESCVRHSCLSIHAIKAFATDHGWKVTDAKNVDAFLFVPARRKSPRISFDALLADPARGEASLPRMASKRKTAILMRSHCAAKH